MEPLTALALLGATGALGAGIGSLASGGGGIFGSKAKNIQVPRYTPEQQNALNQLLRSSLGGLSQFSKSQQQLSNRFLSKGNNVLDRLNNLQPIKPNFDIEPILNKARTGFNQQTIPSLAERFTAMGNNSLSSPAFASQLGQAGAGLEDSLAALRAQYGMQQQAFEAEQQNQFANRQQSLADLLLRLGVGQQNQQQNLLTGLLGAGTAPQFENIYQQRQPGFLETTGTSILQSLPSYALLSSLNSMNAGNQPSVTSQLARQSYQPQILSSAYQQPLGFGNSSFFNFR